MLKKCKYFLLGLFVCLFGFISFSSAEIISTTCNNRGCSTCDTILHSSYCCFNMPDGTDKVTIGGPSSSALSFDGEYWNDYNLPISYSQSQLPDPLVPCIAYGMGANGNFTLVFENSVGEVCPEVNTGEILSGSCDTNYCVENDLCPVPSNFSQLFINDLEFPGTPLINVNIPDYIQWDYASNSGSFDLYVGSGYDMDYMNSIIKINSYRPDSQDFTDTFVSGLTLIFPYIFVALLIVFIWKILKRIFK